MKLKEFEYSEKKDICHKPMHIYLHKKDRHELKLSYFTEEHPDDKGGALIDLDMDNDEVSSQICIYLNKKECLELAKILNKHAKEK